MGRWRGAQVRAEQPFKAAWRHPDMAGDHCGGFGAVQPGLHPGKGGGDAGVQTHIGGWRADLGVSAVAGRGDKGRRHLQRHRRAVPGPDQVQHKVCRRRGPPGGEARPRQHEALRQHLDLGMGGGQIFQVFPVHGGAVPVQQAGARQNPGPGIDPADGAKARGHAAQVADQLPGRHLGLAEACDDDQRIGPGGGGKRARRGQFDAAGQRYRTPVG